MTFIAAISNQKGGVAKTTTCISLGASLAAEGFKTLVVDLDSQSNLTMAAGLDPDDLPRTIADLLDPAAEQLQKGSDGVIQPSKMAGLDILPADVRLAGVERRLYDQENYEQCLAQMWTGWRDRYRFILLDCPPSLGAMTLMALTAAHTVLIPVQCEYYAARGLGRLLDIVAAIRERTNPALTCGMLATMFDQRNSICNTVLAQLQGHFPNRLYNTVIGVDTRLRECPIAGEPITLYAPGTRASQQYRQFAREFLSRNLG